MTIGRFSMAVAMALLAAGSVVAQPFAPRQQTQGAVTYVTGGIGSDEAQMMRDESANYPLTLELAAAAGGPRDEYISNADVRILDSQGSLVLDTRTEGPFMLVRLPAGTYAVDVEWNGVHKQKVVEVGERRQHLMLEFAGSLDVR
jgi:hypothetical protein